MKVTAWTDLEYASSHYIDVDDERIKLHNPEKRTLTPKELTKLAEEKGISNDEAFELWKKEYDKIPYYTDEAKAEEYHKLEEELIQCVIEHCKETGIRFFSDYHQDGDWGIPIIDDKYMVLVSLRKWGEMMALADNDTDEKAYLHYYLSDSDYYSAIRLPFEVESEICC